MHPRLFPLDINVRRGKRRIGHQPSEYMRLPSVWDGEDAKLFERVLSFYPRKRPRNLRRYAQRRAI